MKKSYIFISLIFCTLFLAYPCLIYAKAIDYKATIDVSEEVVEDPEFVEGTVFEDKNKDGKLDANEDGVKDVMVSNGIDVVLTDNNGEYKLPISDDMKKQMTVFITKPAGYDVPVNDQLVPQFFYFHQPEGSPDDTWRFKGLDPTGNLPKEINFPLIKSEINDKFKAIVIGDTQPYSNTEVGYVRDSLGKELANVGNDAEFLIVEGDVVGDDLDLYPRFKEIMSLSNALQYWVPGNHDLNFKANNDKYSFDTYKREWGPTYYSFNIGKVHFVVLDDVRYPCTPDKDNVDGKHEFCDDPEGNPTYNGVINDEQMQWLMNDLSLTPKDYLIVLNLHIPIVSFVDKEATKHQVDNAQALYDLIADRKAVALSGHTHTLEHFQPGEYFQEWEDALGIGPITFPQIITGAGCGSWWSGDFTDEGVPMAYQRLGAPRGYMVFEFDGNTYKEYFKATGKSYEKQITLSFLSPTFSNWYNQLLNWLQSDPETRSQTPPVNINDLPDTSILTNDDLDNDTYIVANVWNGSRDSIVKYRIDGRNNGSNGDGGNGGNGDNDGDNGGDTFIDDRDKIINIDIDKDVDINFDDINIGIDINRANSANSKMMRTASTTSKTLDAKDGWMEMERTLDFIDPFAIRLQMYVSRYAAESTSGEERAQGFELWTAAKFGPDKPQPLPEWMLTDQSNHLWAAKIPNDLQPGVHVLEVCTIDIYGQIYKENIAFEVRDERPLPYYDTEKFSN